MSFMLADELQRAVVVEVAERVEVEFIFLGIENNPQNLIIFAVCALPFLARAFRFSLS